MNINYENYRYLILKECNYWRSYTETLKIPFDEVLSIGDLAFVKASKHFRPQKGYKFTTYLVHVIRRNILNFLKMKSVIFHGTQISLDYDGEQVDNNAPDPASLLEHIEEFQNELNLLPTLLSAVDDRTQKVLVMYSQGYNFREIGEKIGITKQWVSQIYQQGIRTIRERHNIQIGALA